VDEEWLGYLLTAVPFSCRKNAGNWQPGTSYGAFFPASISTRLSDFW
jgi:hypothetical protein